MGGLPWGYDRASRHAAQHVDETPGLSLSMNRDPEAVVHRRVHAGTCLRAGGEPALVLQVIQEVLAY